MRLSVVLQYCTNEFRFLDANLKELSKICDEIIVPVLSHFFNGAPENQELLKKSVEIFSKYLKSDYCRTNGLPADKPVFGTML